MGQAESTPQPAAWQPDFLTAHVKNVSSHLSPAPRAPLAGVSSIGPDSLSVQNAKAAQESIKTTDGGQSSDFKSLQGKRTGMDQHSYLGVAYKQAKEVVAADRPEPIGRPTVGADSFLMVRQRKFDAQMPHGVRNTKALAKDVGKEAFFAAKGMDKPGGHQTIDSYDNQFALDTKKVTSATTGAHGPYGRHQAPEIGKPTKISKDSYYVEFAKTTHSWLAPKSKSYSEWRGLSPVPAKDGKWKDFVKEDKDKKKENIKENATIRALPVPQVTADSYMMHHAREVGEITSTSPLKFGGRTAEPQPYHGYDPAESAYSAVMTPAKAEPQEPLPPPSVGPDSFMVEHVKSAGDMIPKARGKEDHKPPKEDPYGNPLAT